MKKKLLDVSKNMSYDLPLDSAISFQPLIDHIKRRIQEDETVKTHFYKQILAELERDSLSKKPFSLAKLPEYRRLFECIHAYISPLMEGETDIAWGLAFPLYPKIVYGTDHLYRYLQKPDGGISNDFFSKSPEIYRKESLQLLYGFILEKLYNFHVPISRAAYSTVPDPETGVERYFNVNIDNRFVEVNPKDGLPQLDLKMLYTRLNEGDGYEILEDILPLDLFTFSGISIVSITDETCRYAMENIKNSWVLHTPDNEIENYSNLIQYLKMLVNDNHIEFELFPFYRVNNKMVYTYEKGRFSLLASVWGEKRLSPDRFQAEAEGYASNPMFFFSKNINEEKDDMKMLDLFRPYNVCSLALKPVFLNGKPLGVLGIYTQGKHEFDEKVLSSIEEAVPYLAQLLQVYIDEFNLEMENVIKEKFTSIQASVQWKFNEVAWHYLYNRKKGTPRTEVGPVIFENVYPFYGAVDLRNSTLGRNAAVKADLQNQLALLFETFNDIKQINPSPLLDEMIHKCNNWSKLVHAENSLNANEESHLNNYLSYDAVPFLHHLMKTHKNLEELINKYLLAIDEKDGEAFRNKRAFEMSVQLINLTISHYLELEKNEMQSVFPCYFEKFKSDGIEYDIYMGQSIAPDKAFSDFYVKNISLWQLKSMAFMTKMTHALLPEMPIALQTTQLIFAHGKTIDISFRNDERRFDVVGDYSIRYQMIKKRIDKVLISGTTERLTQPGKIAIVYLNRQDVADYREHIHYLQEMKVLDSTLEDLELEDLQGINGLKAIRVGVNYE